MGCLSQVVPKSSHQELIPHAPAPAISQDEERLRQRQLIAKTELDVVDAENEKSCSPTSDQQ